MKWLPLVTGIILLIFAGLSTRKQLKQKGYRTNTVSLKHVPGGGKVASRFSSFVGLLGWLLIIIGIFFLFSCNQYQRLIDVPPETLEYIKNSYEKIEVNGYEGVLFETPKSKARQIIKQVHPNVQDGKFNFQYFYSSGGCEIMTVMTFYNNGPFKAVEISPLCERKVNVLAFADFSKYLLRRSAELHGNVWKASTQESTNSNYNIWKTENYYLSIAYTPKKSFRRYNIPLTIAVYSRVGMRDDIVIDEWKNNYGF